MIFFVILNLNLRSHLCRIWCWWNINQSIPADQKILGWFWLTVKEHKWGIYCMGWPHWGQPGMHIFYVTLLKFFILVKLMQTWKNYKNKQEALFEFCLKTNLTASHHKNQCIPIYSLRQALLAFDDDQQLFWRGTCEVLCLLL